MSDITPVGVVEVDPGQPIPASPLDDLSPQQLAAVLAAAEGFVSRAGDLWDAFVAVPAEDPAHDAIGIVTDIALTAALPLVEEP